MATLPAAVLSWHCCRRPWGKGKLTTLAKKKVVGLKKNHPHTTTTTNYTHRNFPQPFLFHTAAAAATKATLYFIPPNTHKLKIWRKRMAGEGEGEGVTDGIIWKMSPHSFKILTLSLSPQESTSKWVGEKERERGRKSVTHKKIWEITYPKMFWSHVCNIRQEEDSSLKWIYYILVWKMRRDILGGVTHPPLYFDLIFFWIFFLLFHLFFAALFYGFCS